MALIMDLFILMNILKKGLETKLGIVNNLFFRNLK